MAQLKGQFDGGLATSPLGPPVVPRSTVAVRLATEADAGRIAHLIYGEPSPRLVAAAGAHGRARAFLTRLVAVVGPGWQRSGGRV